MDEPPVKLQIRTGGGLKDYKFRFENEWPIARTNWTKVYLKLNAVEQNRDGKPEGDLLPAPVPADEQDDISREPANPCGDGVLGARRQCRIARAHRHLAADRAARRGYRGDGAHGSCRVGFQLVRRHGPVCDDPQHRS